MTMMMVVELNVVQNLMKWSLTTKQRLRMIPKAHKDWILGLAKISLPQNGTLVVSGSRDGCLKVTTTYEDLRRRLTTTYHDDDDETTILPYSLQIAPPL